MTNMLVVLVVIVIIVHRTVHDVSVLENISKWQIARSLHRELIMPLKQQCLQQLIFNSISENEVASHFHHGLFGASCAHPIFLQLHIPDICFLGAFAEYLINDCTVSYCFYNCPLIFVLLKIILIFLASAANIDLPKSPPAIPNWGSPHLQASFRLV